MTLDELRLAVTCSYCWRKQGFGGKTMTDSEYRASLDAKKPVKGYRWAPDADLVRALSLAEKQRTAEIARIAEVGE